MARLVGAFCQLHSVDGSVAVIVPVTFFYFLGLLVDHSDRLFALEAINSAVVVTGMVESLIRAVVAAAVESCIRAVVAATATVGVAAGIGGAAVGIGGGQWVVAASN